MSRTNGGPEKAFRMYAVLFAVIFSVLVNIEMVCAESYAPERVILNITTGPADSQAVTWRTPSDSPAQQAQIVESNTAPSFKDTAITVDASSETVGIAKGFSYHSVIFESLEPDTLYAYRVGSEGAWSEWNQFRTATDQPVPFKFAYFGDPQNDIESMCSRVFREAYKKAPDAAFWLFVGDIVNHGEDDSLWGEFYTALGWIARTTPMVLLPGNHGYKRIMGGEQKLEANKPITLESKGLTRLWCPQFTLPENGPKGLEETSYVFDYQGVRFITLNGNEGLEDQAKWIKKVLKNNPQRWTIVAIHQPFYSTAGDRDNPYLRMLFTKTFDKYRVDLVLQGHDHTYGRTYKVRKGEKKEDNEKGTVYVVSVTGPKQYESGETHKNLMVKTGSQTQLFQVISIDGGTLKYESYTATGELFDTFRIEKNKKGLSRLE